MPRSLIGPRKTQTRVKHTILDRYLKAWGAIIIRGLTKHSIHDAHFVYVDCHAGFGRYNGEIEEVATGKPRSIVYGSPIIGIKALDSLAETAKGPGIKLRSNAILVEEKTTQIEELERSLGMAGLGSRVCKTDTFSDLEDGEIALVNGDSTLLASKLVGYTQSQHIMFSFYILDPYGPKGIPLGFVGEIVRQPRHDVIINMPYLDLQKKQGLVTKPELSLEEKELIRNYDEMFGNRGWQAIVRELEEEALFAELGWNPEEVDVADLPDEARMEILYALAGDPRSDETLRNAVREAKAKDLEIKLINCYKTSLNAVASDITVKSIGLRLPDKERTVYYLYLTTHDPNGALAINKVLWDADLQEHELRWRIQEAKRQPPEQLRMFEYPAPPLPDRERPGKEAIAESIVELLGGQELTRRNVYKALADQPYFNNEIDAALRFLKKEKRVSFEDPLTNNSVIRIGPH